MCKRVYTLRTEFSIPKPDILRGVTVVNISDDSVVGEAKELSLKYVVLGDVVRCMPRYMGVKKIVCAPRYE